MSDLYARLQETAQNLLERTGGEAHDVVVVLGSGLGDYPLTIENRLALSMIKPRW